MDEYASVFLSLFLFIIVLLFHFFLGLYCVIWKATYSFSLFSFLCVDDDAREMNVYLFPLFHPLTFGFSSFFIHFTSRRFAFSIFSLWFLAHERCLVLCETGDRVFMYLFNSLTLSASHLFEYVSILYSVERHSKLSGRGECASVYLIFTLLFLCFSSPSNTHLASFPSLQVFFLHLTVTS